MPSSYRADPPGPDAYNLDARRGGGAWEASISIPGLRVGGRVGFESTQNKGENWDLSKTGVVLGVHYGPGSSTFRGLSVSAGPSINYCRLPSPVDSNFYEESHGSLSTGVGVGQLEESPDGSLCITVGKPGFGKQGILGPPPKLQGFVYFDQSLSISITPHTVKKEFDKFLKDLLSALEEIRPAHLRNLRRRPSPREELNPGQPGGRPNDIH